VTEWRRRRVGAGGGFTTKYQTSEEIAMTEKKTPVEPSAIEFRNFDLEDAVKDLVPKAGQLCDVINGALSFMDDGHAESIDLLNRLSELSGRLFDDIKRLAKLVVAAKEQGKTIVWQEKTEVTLAVRTRSEFGID